MTMCKESLEMIKLQRIISLVSIALHLYQACHSLVVCSEMLSFFFVYSHSLCRIILTCAWMEALKSHLPVQGEKRMLESVAYLVHTLEHSAAKKKLAKVSSLNFFI